MIFYAPLTYKHIPSPFRYHCATLLSNPPLKRFPVITQVAPRNLFMDPTHKITKKGVLVDFWKYKITTGRPLNFSASFGTTVEFGSLGVVRKGDTG